VTATFSIENPPTLEEALGLLSGTDHTVRPIAGGTGLGLLIKTGLFQPTVLVNLRPLTSQLAGVEQTSDGGWRLGALTTLRNLEIDQRLADDLPVLNLALASLATVRLRNVAQLGGSIAHGDPQMDLPPALLTLDATIRVCSVRGERWLDFSDLLLGPYETALANDELIVEVRIPPQPRHRAAYLKCTARTVDDWPIIGVAVVAHQRDGQPGDLRVAIGAVTSTAQRLHAVEAALGNREVNARDIAEAAQDAAVAVPCVDRTNASAAYQRHLFAVYLQRGLQQVLLATGDGLARRGA
jgi:carbon-monoxide dehydrogenase medium subunit